MMRIIFPSGTGRQEADWRAMRPLKDYGSSPPKPAFDKRLTFDKLDDLPEGEIEIITLQDRFIYAKDIVYRNAHTAEYIHYDGRAFLRATC